MIAKIAIIPKIANKAIIAKIAIITIK